ncbi:DUF669 domain-containing protein [Anaerohalosphaeraceae bacterium U12dextr]|jgi:head-tail adaptor
MANLNNFNANEVDSTNDFDPIPAGKYLAMITGSQMKETKNKTGSYLELTFQVLEGEYKGRLLWARLSLTHSNEVTAKIARGHLSAICKAVGVLTPRDSVELHNLPLVINVKVKKRTDNDELTNDIRGFSKQQTAAAPAAVSKPSVAPWKR